MKQPQGRARALVEILKRRDQALHDRSKNCQKEGFNLEKRPLLLSIARRIEDDELREGFPWAEDRIVEEFRRDIETYERVKKTTRQGDPPAGDPSITDQTQR